MTRKTLEDYLAHELAAGHIDHQIRAQRGPDGTVEFYIHAAGHDSDTPTFTVKGTVVEAKWNIPPTPIG